MKVVVLVDGEHYPSVTRWAIDELRERGLEPIAALFVGGGEKLDPSAVLDPGIPLRGSVPERSVASALGAAIDELAPDAIYDLSDEPVLGYRERMEVAAVALARGIAYLGPDFRLRPAGRPGPAARRDGRGAGHRQADRQDRRRGRDRAGGRGARLRSGRRRDGPRGSARTRDRRGRDGDPRRAARARAPRPARRLGLPGDRGDERGHDGGRPARGRGSRGPLLVDERARGRRGRGRARCGDRDRRRQRGVDAPVPVGRWDPGGPGHRPARVPGGLPRPVAAVAIGSCRCYHGA